MRQIFVKISSVIYELFHRVLKSGHLKKKQMHLLLCAFTML